MTDSDEKRILPCAVGERIKGGIFMYLNAIVCHKRFFYLTFCEHLKTFYSGHVNQDRRFIINCFKNQRRGVREKVIENLKQAHKGITSTVKKISFNYLHFVVTVYILCDIFYLNLDRFFFSIFPYIYLVTHVNLLFIYNLYNTVTNIIM